MTLSRIALRFPSLSNPAISGLSGRAAALLLGLASLSSALVADDYTYSTFVGIAGKQGNINGTGGDPLVPLFNYPIGLAINSAGNIFVADSGNGVIRQVTPAGAVTTFVGTAGFVGGNDGTTTDPKVTFNLPHSPVFDSAGNLYVADYAGGTIRKITASGTVTTLAGTAGVTGTLDGTGSAARFYNPSGLAVDSSGNVFVADSNSHTIRKITSAGVVTTFAGTAGSPGSLDGKGAAALFKVPRGLVVDSAGNLYVADTGNNTIRKITTDGTVTTLAGTANTYGSVDATGTAARFNFPNALALDGAGNLYVADENNSTIRKVSPSGVVTTLAGSAGNAGRVDGAGTAARFDHPTGLALDSSGNVYVADYRNQLIRKVSAAGVVTTVAGAGGIAGMQNGTGYLTDAVLLKNPTGTVVDGAGNVYIADSGNNSIKKTTPAGTIMLLAGSSNGTSGSADGTGSNARFSSPTGLALDGAGNLYVADATNQLIRRVSPAGDVTTYAGVLYTQGSADGDRAAATFSYPSSVAADGAGNVFVSDYKNHTIRKIAASGTVTTFAGTAGVAGSSDGIGSSARFKYPRDLALDASGNLYVADSGNHAIRKITPGGLVTTLAGSAGNPGSADGTGSSARFNGPTGLSVDAAGNVFVADTTNSTIRMITASGTVTTIGGTVGSVGTTDGVGAAARFNYPSDVAVDPSGILYIADNRNHTIRKGTLPGTGGGSGGGGGSGSGGSGGSGAGTGVDDSSNGSGFLLQPVGLTSDSVGNFYICDTANHCIKKVDSTGYISVFAGKSGSSGTTDGTGEAARFSSPTGITINSLGELVVTDTGNSSIRKITSAGVVTTFAGSSGNSGTTDGTGTEARFSLPTGLASNLSTGDIYVSDSANSTIRKISSAGVVTTFAGAARTPGDANGTRTNARFNNPTGLALDSAYNLLVCDTYNNTIRAITTPTRTVQISLSGTVTKAGDASVVITDSALTGSPVTVNFGLVVDDSATSVAGKIATALTGNTNVVARYTATSSGADVTLTYLSTVDDSSPATLTFNAGNSVGITSTASSISLPSGVVSTIAGSPGISGAYDGSGGFALFNLPQAIVAAADTGYLYVVDTGNNCIRRISLSANVSTVAGIAGISGNRSGPGEQALFNQPKGIVYFSSVLIVTDTGNSTVRYVQISSTSTNVSTLKLTTTVASTTTTTTTTSTSSGGGGGAPSLWFLGLLSLLGAGRYIRKSAR